MGVDIHPFVEYDDSDSDVPFSRPNSVRPFNEGELFWWRDPKLFRALGSVRMEVARQWLDEGLSIPGPAFTVGRSRRGTEQLPRVSNPTWKQPSWLTTAELSDSIRHAGLARVALKPEVRWSCRGGSLPNFRW